MQDGDELFSDVPETDAPVVSVDEVVLPSPLPPVALDGLPTAIPLFYRYSEGSQRVIALLLGIVVGILASLLAWSLAPQGSMLWKLFDIYSRSAIIPFAISAFFGWGLFICAFRWLRLSSVVPLARKSFAFNATRFVAESGLEPLIEQLERPACQISPLYRRLGAVARQWLVRPSFQNADLVLQEHVAADAEQIHMGFSLVRTLVWALPVLGLVGTVIGISSAVGGFAQFLGGDINDVEVIKRNLVGVTEGLSFAFLITLQGLVTSLILMLIASILQTREERLHVAVQQHTVEVFLASLQIAFPETSDSGGITTPEGWSVAMERATRRIFSVVETLSSNMLRGFEKEMQSRLADSEKSRADIQGAGLILAHSLKAAAEEIEKHVANAASRLGESSAALSIENRNLQAALGQHETALKKFTTDVGDTHLSTAIRDLDSSLRILAPVLIAFRQPFILQAVPALNTTGASLSAKGQGLD